MRGSSHTGLAAWAVLAPLAGLVSLAAWTSACAPAPAGCLTDNDCLASARCLAGSCTLVDDGACVIDADCPSGRLCLGALCVAPPTGDRDTDGDSGDGDGDGDSGDGDSGDGDSGDGDSGDGDGGDGDDDDCGTLAGGALARLLTRGEYDRTLRDLLFVDDDIGHRWLPPENQALGFENNPLVHQVSPAAVDALQAAAEEAAALALEGHLGQLAACAPAALASASTADDAACGHSFVDSFGPRAFRRPLAPDEEAVFTTLMDDGLAAGGLLEGMAFVIEAALQSPQLLYRTVLPAAGESEGEVVAVDGYAVASRLSYLLWGTMPDEALFAAAESGALLTAAGVEGEARRLMADPRAEEAVADFARQWLSADRLRLAEKDAAVSLGTTSEELGEHLRASLLAFVAHAVLENDDSLSALLASPEVFVDDVLAPLYGAGAGTASLSPVALPDDERAGLLTQPALMALLAHPDQSSPIQRGIFVRKKLLCQELPDPPPDVVIQPPDPDPNATTRERFAAHTEEPLCQDCHVLIDPVGFGFEGYDELGRYRTEENGLPVDVSGELLFTAYSPEIEGPFHGAVELAGRLASAEEIGACVASQWFTWAHGRRATEGDDLCSLERSQTALFASGNDLKELLVALAVSDSTRFRAGEAAGEIPPFVEPMFEPDPEPESTPEPDPIPPECVGTGGGAQPQGFLDSITTSGVVYGWALDVDTPCYPLLVNVWMDGPPGTGTLLYPHARADRPRPDVNAVIGVPGDHGLVFVLPVAARDGQPHTIFLEAVDTSGDGNVLLSGSGVTAQVGGGDPVPMGHLDVVTAGGVASGWAFDPSSPPTVVTLEVYLDAPSYLGGALLTTGTTGLARPDVNTAFGTTGDPGFSITLPSSVADGQAHVLFLEALDATQPGTRAFLNAEGTAFQVTP